MSFFNSIPGLVQNELEKFKNENLSTYCRVPGSKADGSFYTSTSSDGTWIKLDETVLCQKLFDSVPGGGSSLQLIASGNSGIHQYTRNPDVHRDGYVGVFGSGISYQNVLDARVDLEDRSKICKLYCTNCEHPWSF